MKQLPAPWRILFTAILVVLALMVVWFFRIVLIYLLVGLVLSLILEPWMNLLQRIRIAHWRLSGAAKAAIVLISFYSILGALLYSFSPLIQSEYHIISSMNPDEIESRLDDALRQSGIPFLENRQSELTHAAIESMQSFMSEQNAGTWMSQFFGVVGSLVIGFFAVTFITFFFLKDSLLFARIVLTITPNQHIPAIKRILSHVHHLLRRYFIGIVIQSTCMTFMVGTSLWLLSIPNAIIIGLFAGLVNVIPYAGPLGAVSFGLFIAVTSSLTGVDVSLVSVITKVLAVFASAQMIDAFVIQPFVLGTSVKAHPLEVFIVILLGGTLGGIPGMVVALPIYTMLRVVASEFMSEFKTVKSLTGRLK
ncbi:MAG: AI-2E family transporter [Flavobacteriales bacterium]